MSLPPINPSKRQHDDNVSASHKFGDIKRGSRNREGKDDEEHKTNFNKAMLKLNEIKEGDSIQDSESDIIQNRYEDENDEEDKLKENVRIDATELRVLSQPKLTSHYASSPIQNVKKDFVTPPQIKTNNNPYVSSQESNMRESNIKDKEECSKLWFNGYGIKYLESIIKDKSLGKGALINSKKIQADINSMRTPIEINEYYLKNNILKFILNDKEEDLFSELEKAKLFNSTPHRDDSNTNLNKDSVINTSINAQTPHEIESKNINKTEINSGGEYKYLVLMCFWFALHLEKTQIICRLSRQESIINRVVSNIVRKYNLNIEIEDNNSISESNDEESISKTKLKLQK